MSRFGRLPLTYANVMSTLALFVALGGTSVAATKLHGRDIQKNTITGTQIRSNSVPGGDLRRDSVTGRQIKESSLGPVPRARHADTTDRAISAGHADGATAALRADQAATAVHASTAGHAGSAGHATIAERAASADHATTATNAAQLDGRDATLYVDRCPPGTQPYAGVCIESNARTTATWPDAAKICGDAGRRLARLDELEGFRQQPGVTLVGTEHTASYLDVNGVSAGGQFTVGINDSGSLSPGYEYGFSNARYRCVAPASNAW